MISLKTSGYDQPAAGQPRVAPRRQEGGAGPAVRPRVVDKSKLRISQGKWAKPLITSLGALTLLAGAGFIATVSAAAGSAQPSDWTRLGWSGVGSHVQDCGQAQGLDMFSCLFGIGQSANNTAAVSRNRHVFYVTETVQDPAPARPGVRYRAPAKTSATTSATTTAGKPTTASHETPGPTTTMCPMAGAAVPTGTGCPTPRPTAAPAERERGD